MYQIVVYIPENHLEGVKAAMFAAGAGRVGNYDACSWQVLGQGQFRPLENSAPYIGSQGEVEAVAEYRVELVCEDNFLKNVIQVMKTAHLYEEPAFSVWELYDPE